MGDRTLLERVMELEGAVGVLKVQLGELVRGVVLVEKRKPGPAHKTVKKGKSKPKKVLKGPKMRRGWVEPVRDGVA